MTRSSHQLPNRIFDAILELELAVREEKDHQRKVAADPTSSDAAQKYLLAIMLVGRKRDELAALILGQEQATTINGGVVHVPLVGQAG
jgi:hypothetical protein